jgi:2-polyprenyl-3-methyl-5-hydroxy-6-metoxy-1,4-benzoquinol methylase
MVDDSESFSVFQCSKCLSVFLGDIELNDEYYEKYYELGYYGDSNEKKKTFLDKVMNYFFKYSVKRKERLILKSSKRAHDRISILDVGCGNGTFLEALDGKKIEKYGLEINQEGCEICRSKGINVYKGLLGEVDMKGKKFDVVTMWHVLEHVEDPVGTMKEVREALNEDGIFVFQVPNARSFGFRIGGAKWFHLDSPRHLFVPSYKGLEAALGESGFEVIGVSNEFYDYPLDLFWSVRDNWLKFVIYPFYPLFKFLSRENLTIICKKA